MKYMGIVVFILAVLVSLLVPCVALAQDGGGDDPCCQGDPRIASTAQSSALDRPIILQENALSGAWISVSLFNQSAPEPAPARQSDMLPATVGRNQNLSPIRRDRWS